VVGHTLSVKREISVALCTRGDGRPQALVAVINVIFVWCDVMEKLMTKRVWSLCVHMGNLQPNRTSVKTKRSKEDLSDLGLNTFKQTRKILMGRMKTKIKA
jgi:hypothetical protein